MTGLLLAVNPGWLVQVAKRELSMECDYEYEARCQKRFKKLISTDPDLAENFNVPDIIDELSGKTVITSEWVPGVHIDKVILDMLCMSNVFVFRANLSSTSSFIPVQLTA